MDNLLTKNGNKRKGKATITAERLRLRSLVWEQLREQIRFHLALKPFGEAKRMARACGVAASQIHRFTCTKCEHDQEPSFTIGVALALYLAQERMQPTMDLQRCNKGKSKGTYQYHYAHSNQAE